MFYFLFLLAFAASSKTLQPVHPVKIANKTGKHKTILDKVVENPQLFVSEVENLDPTALRTIISLLEDLLTTSEARETTLNDAVSDADSAVTDASNVVADAEDVLTGKQGDVTTAEGHLKTTQEEAAAAIEAAEAALATAEQEEADAQGSLDDAKADHTQKVADKEEAESNRGGEIEALNHEQEVIRQVIAILEDLHSKNTPAYLSLDNWDVVNGATIDAGVAKCETNAGSCNIITKGTYTRPFSVSWTSKLLGGSEECVVMDVFPQNDQRHSGYSMGYGWWAVNLGYGLDSAHPAHNSGGDGDIHVNHVYKMVLTSDTVEMWRDDLNYHTYAASTTYMSGKIRIGQSCRNFEVSDVTVTNL